LEETTTMRAQAAFFLSLIALLLSTSTARAEETPFSLEVYDAIETGIDWIRGQQASNGNWGGWGTGVCTLAMLEHPTGPDWAARPSEMRWISLSVTW
jgi:hypothetical protein